MSRLTCHTAGESHGAAMIALLSGFPAGVSIETETINAELARRQGGYGRSGRQKIEQDRVSIPTGLRNGVTIGSPITLVIDNKDHRIDTAPPIHAPRPGHADFAGAMKFETDDCRCVVERASARETAPRVAAGALCKHLLEHFGIRCVGFVRKIGTASDASVDGSPVSITALRDASDVYCPDSTASAAMIEQIRAAKEAKDTLGGVVEVRVFGCPAGLGSCMTWQDKLDGRLMRAVGTIQAIKGVEIGAGFEMASRSGRNVHDPLYFDAHADHAASAGFARRSNNAGGIEGGMTNGMPIIIRAAMKPISTLPDGLETVDLRTRATTHADYERSDVCAVPAASVVAENVVAFEIASALLDTYAGDTLAQVRRAYDSHIAAIRSMGPSA